MNLRRVFGRLILAPAAPPALLTLLVATLGGCTPAHAPGADANDAARRANKIDRGVLVGVRPVTIVARETPDALVSATGGRSAPQIARGPINPFARLGGLPVGAVAGSAAERFSSSVAAFEYIVRKPNNGLVSVMQKDKAALALGQRVLVIAGSQARVVAE